MHHTQSELSYQHALSAVTGQVITRAWNAYGFQLYLELGPLDTQEIGEWTLILSGNWIIESGDQTQANSLQDEREQIEPLLSQLANQQIISTTVRDQTLQFTLSEHWRITLLSAPDDEYHWALSERGSGLWLIGDSAGNLYQES